MATVMRHGRASGLVGEDEYLEAVIEAQTGLPAWVIMFGPIGKLLFLAMQRHRVIVVTDRQVRVFEASVFATKLPIKELSHGLRETTPIRHVSGKMGRSQLSVLGEELWIGKNQDHQAARVARTSARLLDTPEPEGQQAIRDEVLENNRAVVRKRKQMALGALLVVLALIAQVISVVSRDNSFSIAHKAGDQYCGGEHYGEYSAYTSSTSNVLVIGEKPQNFSGIPGLVPQSSRRADNTARFDEIVNHKGNLNADVVVCVQNAGRKGNDCVTGDRVKAFNGRAFDARSSELLTSWEVSAPADCWGDQQPFHLMLCETAGCPEEVEPH